MSRIDGQATEAEIAQGTGFEETHVERILERLRELGAVVSNHDTSRTPSKAEAAPHALTDAPPPAVPASEPAEEDGSLGQPLIDRIEALYTSLESRSYYELLGVPADAKKQQIKAAYFSMIGTYHPDKYYGKELGALKAKLQRIFQRLTEAHDTLTRSRQRATYDATLAPDPDVPPLPRLPHTAPVEATSQGARAVSYPVDSARRRTLAQRLSSTSITRLRPSPEHASVSSNRATSSDPHPEGSHRVPSLDPRVYDRRQSARSAADSLRASLDASSQRPSERVSHGKPGPVPGSPPSARELLSRAEALEQQKRWAEAAKLYARAAEHDSDPHLFRRAADCALLYNGSLREAAEYARRATALAPDDAELHLHLARIYARAGMQASASSEFEKAKRLSGEDDTMEGRIEQIKKELS